MEFIFDVLILKETQLKLVKTYSHHNWLIVSGGSPVYWHFGKKACWKNVKKTKGIWEKRHVVKSHWKKGMQDFWHLN